MTINIITCRNIMEVSISKRPPYSLVTTDTHFYLKSRSPHFKDPSYIKINRLTSKVTILTEDRYNEQMHTSEKKTKEDLYLLLGIMIVNQQPYLCTAAQAEPVATLNTQKIFVITKVNFIPFKHKFLYRVINQSENQKILEEIGQSLIKDHFYFCYHRDITLTQQKLNGKKETERKYFWNEHMLQMFSHYGLPRCWRIPIVQGHVKQLYCENEFFSFYYCVISRRSKHMSGTRFSCRGIDVNFNVANFVETEEIFICHNYMMTHVAVRGSVPIFWQQEGFGAPIKFSHPDQENMLVLSNHLQFLKRQYEAELVLINLLSEKRQSQRDLSKRYDYYLRKTMPNQHYIHYDFNEQIKNKENSVHLVIDRFINNHLSFFAPDQNFFCIDRYTNKIYCRQKAVPRINCLDCLDRSNVIMSRISLIFIHQVEVFINSHHQMPEKQLKLSKQYKDAVIEIWAELGNRISLIYSGTDSVATHLTKRQQSSFFNLVKQSFKSIGRYYQSNVNDSFKQQCIDVLLGLKEQNSKTSYFDDNITKSILDQTKYNDYEQLVMYILSWNCNIVDPDKITARDLDKLFNFPIDKTDMIVVCLQEMVELSSFNVLMGNNINIVGRWKKMIEKHLSDVGKDLGKTFVHLTSNDMVGIATFVYVSGHLFNRIYKHEWTLVKTGFNNSLGNKGSIMLFMQIDNTYLTLANCHLTAGQNAAALRLQDIEYIHNDALNQRAKRRLFDQSEFKFFIGDMNFRLEAKNESVREILYTIEKQDVQKKLTKSDIQTYLQSLLQKDEYYLNNNSGSLSMYSEGTIYFLPTYKYIKKEKMYDIKRTPAWCDRIFFSCTDSKKLAILKYWDIDCYQSDHKPICGAFKILVRKEDADKKKKLLQTYMDQDD